MTGTEPRALADAIRFLSIDAIERVGEGHPGTPLGAADTVTALFTRHLKFLAREPLWFDRDRFVLSNGHGSMLLYALLHLSGYEGIGLDDIKRFRELGSPCEGHPEYAPAHGIETTTGPLGQGIANAAGMALAEAYLNRWLGPDLIDHRTYALVGDGCLQEGVGQEVISLAGHLGLGKLTFLWDDNRMTDDGAIDLALSDDMAARFRLSHWHVQEIDGHDIEAVSAALLLAKADPRPSMIRCTTVIGRGLPGVEGTRAAHSARIPASLSAAARQQLNWPHPAFEIPDGIRAAWREAGARNAPNSSPGPAASPPCRRSAAACSTACARASCRRAGRRPCAPSATRPHGRARHNPGSRCRASWSTASPTPSRNSSPARRISRARPSTSARSRPSPPRTRAGATSITASASTPWGR